MEQQLTEEQVKELQEKIKQMSPDELKEFQKKQCIFCQIIAGKVQSKKIYEDSDILAVLDVNPANPGHMLVMPKEHYSILPQIPNEDIGHLFTVTKALSNAALRSLEVQGSNIIVANGVAAGQRAQHFMIHLIPRKDKDNIKFEIPQNKHDENTLKKTSEILSKSLGSGIEKSSDHKNIHPVFDAEFEDLNPKKAKKTGRIKKLKSGKSENKGLNTKISKVNSTPKSERERKRIDKVKDVQDKSQSEDNSKDDSLEDQDLDEIARVLGVK
jgi:histidine triad (HIT) family protein